MADVVKVRERRAAERVKVDVISKEDAAEVADDRKKSIKRRKDSKKVVKAFKDKKFADLSSGEKDKLLQAVAIALGLIKE